MNSVVFKMAAAFALVAVLTVVAVGVAAQWAVNQEFQYYLFRVRVESASPGEPGTVPAPGDHPGWMRRMMGQGWGPAISYFMGLPERRFLTRVREVLWQVGVVAAAVGAGMGVVMASTMTRRLHRLSQRALAIGAAAHAGLPETGDELDRLDAAFTTMERTLERKEQQRRQLLADIAHELKTPLTVVQANLEAMLDDVTPATPQRIAGIHTQVVLLARLVNDLRDLAMAEAGELPVHRERVDLADLVEAAADLWRPRFDELHARLTVTRAPSPQVLADPDRIGQVMANLLSNAVRHLPAEGGEVRIRVEPAAGGREVVVSVEDNGPGIPEGSLPHIFDHFFRADLARARSTGGSGIGLAVVRSVIEAHGGRVFAENRREGGARFTFVLPAAGERARRDETRRAAVPDGRVPSLDGRRGVI
ncbi:HAMP domain-containing sensor histidine kinase [Carboxydochorda subterranea]|uniref:histidine kinase n=1 Tax=Carboxydichorda subterranea TaxID=3109565 RepID=A0ABZ1BW13_9FIRM|nr:HAMP domain-containing sensor histidine kinase [Limnochorda sp. L945t]WRP16990.1 HAMP domain-containing sensor histidine kinase [Limnochorda sp. L945t]